MLEPIPSSRIARNDIRYAHGEHQDRHKRAAYVQQKDDADQCYDNAFLDECGFQCGDCPVDEFGAIVDRHNFRALGQRRCDFFEPVFDVVDDGQGVGAGALQGDATYHFAFAVKFSDTTPFVARQLDASNILEQHRSAAIGLDHNAFNIVDAF